MSDNARRRISILIPTYNEQDNVVPLCESIMACFARELSQYDCEILFIDNCSRDKTRERLRALCAQYPCVRAILNARNFGQFSSPFYGICQTTGDCTISMCADFQDPVEMIPVLVAKWEQGHRVVCAVKTESRENRVLRVLRSCYYKLIRRFSETEQIEHFTGFGLYDADFVAVMRALDDPTPFLRGVVAELGFGLVTVPYTQQKRRMGRTSNGVFSLYDAAWQSFSTYTKAPIRMMMGVAIALFLASVAGGIAALAAWPRPFWLLLSVLGGLAAVQMAFLSVLGEYLLTVRSKVVRRPLVVEEERLNFDKGATG